MAETKQSIVGIAIPEECGKVNMYEISAILYHDDNSDMAETEYQVFITKEDFEKSAPFATIKANMNPEILLYPDEEHRMVNYLFERKHKDGTWVPVPEQSCILAGEDCDYEELSEEENDKIKILW